MPTRHQLEKARREALADRLRAAPDRVMTAVDALGIERWNYLVISDGSGMTWNDPCGWAALLVSYRDGSVMEFKGGFDHGTNNVAELMGCLQPLIWLVNSDSFNIAHNNIHVLTDSDWLVNVSAGVYQRNSNVALWAVLDALRRQGLQIAFHWIPRGIWAPNKAADTLAGATRKAIINI